MIGNRRTRPGAANFRSPPGCDTLITGRLNRQSKSAERRGLAPQGNI